MGPDFRQQNTRWTGLRNSNIPIFPPEGYSFCERHPDIPELRDGALWWSNKGTFRKKWERVVIYAVLTGVDDYDGSRYYGVWWHYEKDQQRWSWGPPYHLDGTSTHPWLVEDFLDWAIPDQNYPDRWWVPSVWDRLGVEEPHEVANRGLR